MSEAMETMARAPRPRRPGRLGVLVAEGPDPGARLAVDRRCVVGSSEGCDLTLADPMVSRRHLALEPSERGLRVTDLESRNGTSVGAIGVADVTVREGAEIRIGESLLRVERVDAAPEPARPRIDHFGRFLGAADALQPMYEVLRRVAPTDATVLLEGESGTGKEVLAEALLEESARAEGPFVVIDCGSLPENLVESELFGHERGAFTGAEQRRVGAFERGNGGTVFLDEVGELPLPTQTRLLRVIESRQVRRVGGSEPIDLDVRLIAATNRDLEREVENGRFRLDLFHRLSVVAVRVPPLRERREDVPLLARALARTLGAESPLEPAQVARLASMNFPGNTRELRNHVERIVLLGDVGGRGAGPPRASDQSIDELARAGRPYSEARALVLERFTDAYCEDMLERHQGNLSAAARAAGIGRRYFQRLRS